MLMDEQASGNLKVSLIQSPLAWENIDANLEVFDKKIDRVKTENPDLIVLPEMFNTGFSMNSKKLAEPPYGKTYKWMKSQSEQTGAAITGSVITEEHGNFYNRMYWVTPDGKDHHYDKRHLFRMAGEHHHFSPGEKRLVVEFKGWKIMPLVCYDLRFPVWSRNQNKVNESRTSVEPEYDLLIYVANWPKPRANAWSSLLVARAIENQVYVAGVNRVGEDGKGIPYSGNSVMVDPKGQPMTGFKPGKEQIETVEIDFGELNRFRKKFPVGLDADGFGIT